MNREAWLNAFTDKARPFFDDEGSPLPLNVRVSIGFTSRGAKGKRIGECWADACSADGHFEIFIKPDLQSDGPRVADILTHELCHAAAGLEAGHGPAFKRIATRLGLEGKMTATVAGARWHAWADAVLAELGPFPGAALNGGASNAPKKQGTRMIKLSCNCGWTCRTARANIVDDMLCPLPGCGGNLIEA